MSALAPFAAAVVAALPVDKALFNPHPEHAGAKGAMTCTNGVFALAYDFTGGGHAVGVEFLQDRPVWAERVLFDACVGDRQRIAVVARDSAGQSFYKPAEVVAAGAWRRYACDLSAGWRIHWGGPDDGLPRPPFTMVSVTLDRMTKGVPGPGEVGTAYVKNVGYEEIPVAKRVTAAREPGGVRYLVSDFRKGADRFSGGPRMFCFRNGDYREDGTPVTDGVVTNDFARRPELRLHNEIPVWGRPLEFLLTVEAPAEAAGLAFALEYRSDGGGRVPFGRLRRALPGEKTVCQTFSVAGPGGEGWWTQTEGRKFNPAHRSRRVMQVVVSRGDAPAKAFPVRFVRLEAVVRGGADLPPLLATPPTGAEAPRELEIGFLNLENRIRTDAGVKVALRDWSGGFLGEVQGTFPATAPGARSFLRVPLPAVPKGLNYVQYRCEPLRGDASDIRIGTWETSWTRPWSGDGTCAKRPEVPWGIGVYIHRSEALDAYPSGYETPTNAASLARMEWRAELARKAGFKWERVELKPAQVEFRRGEYDFFAYDRMLDALDRNGVSYYILLSHYWPGGYRPYSREGMDEWAKVAGMAAARYRGRCRHYEVWNEANIFFWKGTTEDYVYLVNKAYDAIKAADPDAVVAACSTAGVDLGFMDKCIALGMKCDSISIHPYRVEPVEGPFLADLAATTNRTRGAKTYLTELGWPTGCDHGTYPERTQAGWFVRNYLTAAGSGTAVAINGYDFVDDGFNVLERENNFGILRRDLTPKPAYRALATLCNFFAAGTPALEKRPLGDGCTVWIFRMGGRSAVWSDRRAELTVTCDGPATARNPVDEVLSSGTPVHALRTDGLRAVFLDRDVRTVEGRPAPAAATSVVTF